MAMAAATWLFGPGQQLYRIIPRTILFIRLGRKLQLHGGGAGHLAHDPILLDRPLERHPCFPHNTNRQRRVLCSDDTIAPAAGQAQQRSDGSPE